jgi:hypothetical protein
MAGVFDLEAGKRLYGEAECPGRGARDATCARSMGSRLLRPRDGPRADACRGAKGKGRESLEG